MKKKRLQCIIKKVAKTTTINPCVHAVHDKEAIDIEVVESPKIMGSK